MNKEDFADKCVKSGYCSKKLAYMYSQKTGKDNFEENDFIEVYRIRERALDIARGNGKYQDVQGAKTTKRYCQTYLLGSDRR